MRNKAPSTEQHEEHVVAGRGANEDLRKRADLIFAGADCVSILQWRMKLESDRAI
jgi:hypothetical protein